MGGTMGGATGGAGWEESDAEEEGDGVGDLLGAENQAQRTCSQNLSGKPSRSYSVHCLLKPRPMAVDPNRLCRSGVLLRETRLLYSDSDIGSS